MVHDYTPDLPDVFPDGTVRVEDEQHRYETFAGDSGSVLEETEYTLDKAPIDEIIKVTGVVDGDAATFDKGVDYQLVDLVLHRSDQFTFTGADETYVLSDGAEPGTSSITDASGDTYEQGVDYDIDDTNRYEFGTVYWIDGGSTPDLGEDFTVEFDVVYPHSVIEWDSTETTPDAGSFFYVTYRSESVISRYIQSGNEQFGTIEHELSHIIESKFVDSAEGDELDELGKVFGVLGRRSERSDQQYRIYLKSIVQSFISRGTVNGIKLAISAATDVPLEDITINENFEENEYEVQIVAATPITGSLLERVADIADPSGVAQSRTRFTLPADETVVDDVVTFTEGQQIADAIAVADSTLSTRGSASDTLLADDAAAINPNKNTAADTLFADDASAVNPNKSTAADTLFADDAGVANRAEASDTLALSDAFAIDPRTTTVSEILGINDPVATPRGFADETIDAADVLNVEPSNKNAHEWEDDGSPERTAWNFFEWTEIVDILIELTEAESDTLFADDAVTIPAKDATTADTGGSNDAVNVVFNETFLTDTAVTDDAVTIPPKDATTADTGGSNDVVTNVSQTLVTWDTRDWNSLNWVQEHN